VRHAEFLYEDRRFNEMANRFVGRIVHQPLAASDWANIEAK